MVAALPAELLTHLLGLLDTGVALARSECVCSSWKEALRCPENEEALAAQWLALLEERMRGAASGEPRTRSSRIADHWAASPRRGVAAAAASALF